MSTPSFGDHDKWVAQQVSSPLQVYTRLLKLLLEDAERNLTGEQYRVLLACLVPSSGRAA